MYEFKIKYKIIYKIINIIINIIIIVYKYTIILYLNSINEYKCS